MLTTYMLSGKTQGKRQKSCKPCKRLISSEKN